MPPSTADPTPEQFLRALEADLQFRHVPFDLGDLIIFVEACWPRIADAPDVLQWADRFQERLAEVSTRGVGS